MNKYREWQQNCLEEFQNSELFNEKEDYVYDPRILEDNNDGIVVEFTERGHLWLNGADGKAFFRDAVTSLDDYLCPPRSYDFS